MSDLLKQIRWIPSLSLMWKDIVQIIILTFVLYYLVKSLYKTRAWILVKGLMMIGGVYLFIMLTEMAVLQAIMNGLFSTLLIAIIIMLQPELQKIVELIGTKQLIDIRAFFNKHIEEITYFSEKTIAEIVDATKHMGAEKTGALIVLERKIPLKDCIQSGIEIKATVSNQLLINIFEKDTPLHDGAVIVKNNKIESATSYLPLSNNANIDKKFGTRHRAAIGISETSDCIVVIVSEETGAISLCENGKIYHNISPDKLSELLHGYMSSGQEKEIKKERSKTPMWVKYLAVGLSVIVWISVSVAIDPVMDATITNVPVSVINDSVLSENQKTYKVQSGDTISVKIEGKRSVVQQVTNKDIVATANFKELSITNAIPIKINIPTYGRRVDILNDNQVMTVEIENIVQTSLPVVVEISGKPSGDKVPRVSDEIIEPLVLDVPQSMVKTLDKAVVTVDVTGYGVSFTKEAEPTIYDKNGNIVDMSRVKLSKEKILASVDILETKKIPLVFKLKEQDKKSDIYFDIESYEAEQDEIKIATVGENVEIDKLEIEILPDVNSDNVNTLVIDLKQHLPEGVYLSSDQEDKITVEFELIKYQKKALDLTKNDIKLIGYKSNKHKCIIKEFPEKVEFYYDVLKHKNEKIDIEFLKAIVEVKETTPGTYSAKLQSEVQDILFVDDYKIEYKLSDK